MKKKISKISTSKSLNANSFLNTVLPRIKMDKQSYPIDGFTPKKGAIKSATKVDKSASTTSKDTKVRR